MTIKRIVDAAPAQLVARRNAAYVRLTKDGEDHTGQIDQIETWAEQNHVVIDEWFVDKGPAHMSNELPELKRLIAEADSMKLQRIAVMNRNVFCRDPDVSLVIVQRLQREADLFYAGKNHKSVPKRVPFIPVPTVSAAAQ